MNISKYFENTNDTTFRAIAPNTAPHIWLLKVTPLLGINLYNNKNIINVANINAISVIISDIVLKFSNAPKWLCIIDTQLFPNTNNTNPIVNNIMNIIVSTIAFIRKYITFICSSLFTLYTPCRPFVNAYKPFPADHNVNIIDIDIVPIDFEYTSLTIPNTISFILAGIIFDIASNNACCSILVY